MISVSEARRIVLEKAPRPVPVALPLSQALGCVLAAEIVADQDVPSFRRAAMDGYALRAEETIDPPRELQVVEEIQAGQLAAHAVGNGEALRIMTGAPLPEGADAILPVEKTERLDDGRRVRLLAAAQPGAHITPIGHEVRKGHRVLAQGSLIGPAELGVLAIFGQMQVPVYRRPRIAAMATGNELVAVEETPGPAQIRNSNLPVLQAQLARLRLEAVSLGIVRDDPAELEVKIGQALAIADYVFLTGGVSMGDHDYCRGVFRHLGIEIHFERLNMKPAKPTTFGTIGAKAVFGLPGNPVSAFVAFENFGRPALFRSLGLPAQECLPRRLRLPLVEPFAHKSDRETYQAARLDWREEGLQVNILKMKGSADLAGFSRGDCLAVLPPGRRDYRAGESVTVQLL